jgi:23S rRNA pseudouridine1911/1915/1917 synthase
VNPSPSDTIVVQASHPSVRLDRFLHTQFPEVSRSTLQRLIIDCDIKVNGAAAKPTHTPRAGDVITVVWPKAEPSEVLPQEIPLEVLHEDPDLLVINKPAELVVHPSAGHEDGTIVNAVLHHCQGQLSGIGGVERPGIVHRLDLGTSGCLVIAKHDRAHIFLTEQFAERTVEKLYQCIVCGDLQPPTGDIQANIARHPTHRKRMAVTEKNKGRFAWTSYQLLQRLKETAFVEANLHTGRTHQIRVHFQHLGFPILGDDVYGKRQTARVKEKTGFVAPRQLLHARKLTLRHPRTKRIMEFNAPLPVDFKDALAALQLET